MNKVTMSVLSSLMGAAVGVWFVSKIERNRLNKAESTSGKFIQLFHLMNQWVNVKQDGKNLSSYLEKNNYKKIAIYGMSHVGETLLHELDGTGIEVLYGIDKSAYSAHIGINIVTPEGALDEVDAIVVTAVNFYDEIVENLKVKVNCPIISLEDILFGGN